MQWYLVLEPTLALEPRFADELHALSGGRLNARSSRNIELSTLILHHKPDWRAEPALVERDHDGARVSTGHALRRRLFALLGPATAWHVAGLVARVHAPVFEQSPSRRHLLKGGISLAGGAVGMMLLGPVPSVVRAQEEDEEVIGAEGIGATGIQRPGRDARRAGVERWTVRRSSGGYRVTYDHERQRFSGTVRINFTNDFRTGTWNLTRDGERAQAAFTGNRMSATGVDGDSMVVVWNIRVGAALLRQLTGVDGDSMVVVWDRQRERWETDAQSRRAVEANSTDFNIGFGITSDIANHFGRRRRATAAVEAAAAACTNNLFTERAQAWTRSIACDWATINLNEACNEVPSACQGDGCCRVIEGCDCACAGDIPVFGGLTGDYACHCSRHGYTYGNFC